MTLKVLIADDDCDIVDSMTKLLRFMGHEVHIASDVPSAIHEAPLFGPDVVLVDFVVPAIEVQDLAEQFRRNPSLAKTPLVAVGRLAGVCQHAESGESAFDGLVTLPSTRAELARLLARVQAKKISNVDQIRSEQWRERRAKREAYLQSPSPGMKRIIFRFFGGMRDGQELI
ncbi:MAG TPA: response regulator, partial [Pirellulales bacterium]|nr:response regulator [Pirellulales bacterium]